MKPRTFCQQPPRSLPPPPRPSRSVPRPRPFVLGLILSLATLGQGVERAHGQTAPCAAAPCATQSADAPAAAPISAPAAAPVSVAPAAPNPVTTPRAVAPIPASAPPAEPRPTPPVDPVRRRCRTAGVVMLSLAGATLVGFFGTLVYNAIVHPGDLSLDPVPRFVFALSAVSFGISGSVLLAYGRSTPSPPPVRPTLAPPPPLPSVRPTAPDAPAGLGTPGAALELRF